MKRTTKIYNGDLVITDENKASHKDITSVVGDLKISEGVKASFKKLTEVSGYIDVSENATLTAPALVKSGYIYVSENATLTAPALAEVSGCIDVRANATLTAPALVKSGYIYVRANATLTAPALVKSGYIYVSENATLNIPQTKGLNYRSVDNTLFVIEREKTSKGIKIYTGRVIEKITDSKAVSKPCYVAEKEGFFAHGSTVKQAISDLQFKIVAEKLKNEPIEADTLITVKHYRLVTGACDHGVRGWMHRFGVEYSVENEGTSLERTVEKEPMKAKDLLPLLRKSHAFGLERFESLLNFE